VLYCTGGTGIQQTGPKVPEIVFVMDNCAGQNKNRHVLRLLPIMVATGMTDLARSSFLIKGHTKNDCDRTYNEMKKQYRHANCYTPEDMCNFIETSSDNVTMVRVDRFMDWDTYEDKYMDRPSLFLKHHVFTVTADRPNIMQCQEAIGEPVEEIQLVKDQYNGTDWTADLQLELQALDPPGLRDIKWRTMYDQWRKYIPEHKRKTFKYYSVDPGSARRSKITENTAKAKAIRLKRSVTEMVSVEDDEEAAAPAKKKAAAPRKKAAATAPKKKAAATAPKKKTPAVKSKTSKKITKRGSWKSNNVI
jgi:hypothetical protein